MPEKNVARPPGKLIVFEGPDGVGKSTLAKALASKLCFEKLAFIVVPFPGKEPGSLGKLVYDVHHDPGAFDIREMSPCSLQLLHIAAHADAIEKVILPSLKKGVNVVLDRFWWSTWVYGVVSGADGLTLKRMISVELSCWKDIQPSITFLIRRTVSEQTVPEQKARQRLWNEYQRLAASEAKHYRVEVVNNDRSLSEVLKRVASLLRVPPASVPSPKPRRTLFLNSESNATGNGRKGNTHHVEDDLPLFAKRPTVISKLSPAKPTEVYDTYWRFAAERQAIFFRKLKCPMPPWTDDPILQKHKFTNAYRASDRVSQYLIKNVIYKGDRTAEEIFFRLILFKTFNRIETWELLQSHLGNVSYCDYRFELYDKILSSAMAAGSRIYSAAYMMSSGRSAFGSAKKHRNHLRLIEKMMQEEVPLQITKLNSMQKVFDLLLAYPTFGGFLSYQYTIDINYSELTDFNEMEFVVPGPGARDGIQKCFAELGGLNEVDIIKLVTDRQEVEFERLGLEFRSLWGRRLQLIDCQNLFCEVGKYARVAHPHVTGRSDRTRIKQKYTPNKSSIQYWFPPKWRLNERIAAGKENVPSIPE